MPIVCTALGFLFSFSKQQIGICEFFETCKPVECISYSGRGLNSPGFIELSVYSQVNFLRFAIPYGDIIYIHVFFNPDTKKIYLPISINNVKNIKSPCRKVRSHLYCFCKLTSN